MSQNREVLFHARFPKSGFVSHFKGIGRKRETNGHFRKVLPLKEPLKTMKRGRRKPEVFVSPRTRARFTPFHISFRATRAAEAVIDNG